MTQRKELLNPASLFGLEQQQITTQDEMNIWVPGEDTWLSNVFDTDITRDAPLRKSPVDILVPGAMILETNSKIFDIQFNQRISGGPLPLLTRVMYLEFNDISFGPTPTFTKSVTSSHSIYRDIGHRAIYRFLMILIFNLNPEPNTLILDELKIMSRIDG